MRSAGPALLLLLLAAPASGEGVWVVIERPRDGAVEIGSVGLSEVRGYAGVGGAAGHDVVVAVDVSGSTLLASGVDVDGDGLVGRPRQRLFDSLRRALRSSSLPRFEDYSSDPGDSIREAELVAAERLFERLDPAYTRAGLVTFDHQGQVDLALGAGPAQLAAALGGIRERSPFRVGGTSFEEAIRVGLLALGDDPPAAAAPRTRSLVLLSDGKPTWPPPESRARERALAAAQRAAAAGVRIHSFALGPEALEHRGVYREIAELAGGSFVRVERPGDVVALLPAVDLAGLAAVELRNLTTGAVGRAVRVAPDGSFDGLLALAPGWNRLRVRASGAGGGEARAQRSVLFDRREPANAAEARELGRRLERLRQRLAADNAERELLLEMEQVRAQRRELELRPAAAP